MRLLVREDAQTLTAYGGPNAFNGYCAARIAQLFGFREKGMRVCGALTLLFYSIFLTQSAVTIVKSGKKWSARPVFCLKWLVPVIAMTFVPAAFAEAIPASESSKTSAC